MRKAKAARKSSFRADHYNDLTESANLYEKALHQGTKRKKRHRETKVIFVSSGGARGGARGPRPPFISRPNLARRDEKKLFGDRYSLLMTGLPDPPVSRSGPSAGFCN